MLWDLEQYRVVATLEGHVGLVYSARFVSGGHEIVTAGADGAAWRWDGHTGRLRQIYRGGSRFLVDATLTADGTMVVAGDGDGLLRFWDVTGHPLWKLQAHKSHAVGIRLEGDDIVTRGFAGDVSGGPSRDPHRSSRRRSRSNDCTARSCVIVRRRSPTSPG